FDKCGIGEKTYITFASGGSFSKYSHEFQTITDAGEDKIFICDKCKIAINSEIIEEQKICPVCSNPDLKEAKTIEVGNIFPLKTKYSEPFGLKFTDKDGSQKDVVMGCYGLGLTRLLGIIAEINNDDKGIIWPKSVAPFAIHLIVLSNESKIKNYADDLYKELQKAGIEILYDDREGLTAGEKFADADLIGIPCRVVVSEKTVAENKIEIKMRNEEKVELIDKEKISKYL
ncbi:prolyl-tRNA synthetase, partial [Patescibacteria group bacterium]|nr:prolyl-tRNA synthetase [Patescibacteria group bacterium]